MKYNEKIIAFIFFAFCQSVTLCAQGELLFRHLNRNDGLLHSNVTCIAQDSLGYIWFGTHRGLNRYDGYSVDSYKYEDGKLHSLYFNRIHSIQILGGYLWTATDAGLACFDLKIKQYIDFRINDKLDKDFYQKVRTIKPGVDNQMWLVSSNKIRVLKINPTDDEHKQPTIESLKIGDGYEFLSDELYPRLALDKDGNAWITGRGYLSAYKRDAGGELIFSGNKDNNIGTGVRNIYCDDSRLWITYEEDLKEYLIENNKYTLLREIEIGAKSELVALYVDKEYAWVMSNEVLLQIPKNSDPLQIIAYKHSPFNPRSVGSDMNNMFIDRNNNLWISTWGGGISYANIAPRFFNAIHYSPVPSGKTVNSEFISSMHYDKNGHVYIGSKLGGLSSFNIRTKEVDPDYCVSDQLLPSITSLQSDEVNIYAAVKNYLVIIRKKDKKVIASLQTANEGYIFWLAFDKYKRLWVATQSGLECYEKSEGKWVNTNIYTNSTPEPNTLSSNQLHNIYSDTVKNELLITSSMGINRMMFDDKGKVLRVVKYLAGDNDEHSLSSNFVWPIDKGSDSIYWVGTMGSGLNKVILRDNSDGSYDYTATAYGKESGATSNDIESVEVDNYGNVWCSGFYLSCFDDQLKRFNIFDINDGLQSEIFGTSSSCKDFDGNLYFGGTNGFNYFTPKHQVVDSTRYHVYFSRFYINGEMVNSDIEFSKELILNYPDNNFSVDFTSLFYDLKQHIRYRYKLEGYDDDWRLIETGGKPTVSYQKISYGKHKLIVEAGNWENWNGEQYALTIYSHPPFWRTWWAYTFYFLLLILLTYIGIRYFFRWMQMKNTIAMQQEEEKRKEEMVEMKMRFFTDVSHEFRTPLTLINSAITEIEENQHTSADKYFNVIKRNAGKLLKLVNELLDFHRSDIKAEKINATYISISEYIRCIYEEFKGWAESSQISITLESPAKDIKMWVDQEHFGKILSNILSNSILYSKAGSEINIRVKINDLNNFTPRYKNSFWNTSKIIGGDQLIVSISDGGIGIEKGSLPEIFNRFVRVDRSSGNKSGSGIGLSLVKSLVELHHGGIVVSSNINEGTEFTIALPVNDNYLTQEEKNDKTYFSIKDYLSDYVLDHDSYETEEPMTIHNDGMTTILLVDDNYEILMVLRAFFIKDYNIVMATDGREALEKCNNYFPDIVISDVMMPKMDGIELCTTLKESLRTCFIPVILLSAKALIEHQIEGIETGADAYIPKPFNFTLLKATVRNLLKKSQQIKDALPTDNIRQNIIDKRQDELFDKLTDLINNNLINKDFSINHLCLELGLNRTKLYSTIKSITGMTLANYIRKIRLDKAAELLKTTDLTISEIGYSVGLESPSYFTRAFKEQFGMSPSEFIK
jgi:signal transduction histidine kinase/DNA-binding response OmpR family regulator/ligand-binding sensor domain-containing protein